MTKFNEAISKNKSSAKENNTTNQVPHIEVIAYAGTGKTTTSVEGILYCKGLPTNIIPSDQQQAIWEAMEIGKFDSIRFSSFGNAITQDNGRKLKERGLDNFGCEARTLNSLGFQSIIKNMGYKKPTAWATKDIIAGIMGRDAKDLLRDADTRPVIKAVDELVDKCKQNMITDITEDALWQLAEHYDIDTNHRTSEIMSMVPDVIEKCKEPKNAITFTDQVWLPIVLDLPIQKMDLQIIDEAQDLNRMQQELAMKAGHRIMYVGDPNQAIFGFAGADSQSMFRLNTMLSEHGVNSYPLTVTRRCGKLIVEEAKRYVPNFAAHENNPTGIIESMKYPQQDRDNMLPWSETYGPHVLASDLIICRTNAPLIKQCLKFLANNVYAFILGRKVGEKLISIADKIIKDIPTSSIFDFISGLEDWHTQERGKEQAKKHPSDSKLESINDHYECLMSFAEGLDTTQQLTQKISDLFPDDSSEQKKEEVENRKGIKLSSIHRAKGMEADTVYFLRPKGYGRPIDKMKGWEVQEENNLTYVAITRAKNKLVYVS